MAPCQSKGFGVSHPGTPSSSIADAVGPISTPISSASFKHLLNYWEGFKSIQRLIRTEVVFLSIFSIGILAQHKSSHIAFGDSERSIYCSPHLFPCVLSPYECIQQSRSLKSAKAPLPKKDPILPWAQQSH